MSGLRDLEARTASSSAPGRAGPVAAASARYPSGIPQRGDGGCHSWRTRSCMPGGSHAMLTRVGVLLTSSRHVSGLYEIGNARLSDALNNTLVSVVRLTNATLGRLGNP